MKTRLAIFFVLWVALVAVLVATAAPPPVLPPIQRNFFTTNVDPIVDVLAGSNATVQATTVGTDTRHFTVNARTDTNVVNILIGGGGTASFATNALNATNFWGFLSWTNIPTVSEATNAQNAVNATNFWGMLSGTNLPAVLTNGVYGSNVIGSVSESTHSTNSDNSVNSTNFWGMLSGTNLPAILTNAVYGSNVIGAVAEATHATNADNASNSTNFWGLLSATNLPAGLSTSNYVGTFTGTGDNITNSAGYSVGYMADTNWVLNQLASYGSYLYFGGPTNSFAITNSGETVSRTNVWTGSISPFSTAATSSVASLTLNAYVRHVISTNTFSVIESGPVSINTYPFKAGGGTPQIHYEFYAVDTVSNIMYELAAGPATQITATVPTLIQTSLTLTNSFIATNRCYFCIAAKIDNVGAGNTLYWAHGGVYDARATFVRPLSSATINASQIVGVLPPGTVCGTTNTADGWVIGNTNQVRMWTQNGGALTNLNLINATNEVTRVFASALTNNDSRTLNFTNVNFYGTVTGAGGGSSNITDSAYVAVARGLSISTNFIITPQTLTQSTTNVTIDLAGPSFQLLALNTNANILVSNPSAGASVIVDITCDTTNRYLSFDTSFTNWIGTPRPTMISSNHVAWLRIVSTGTTTNGLRGFWGSSIP